MILLFAACAPIAFDLGGDALDKRSPSPDPEDTAEAGHDTAGDTGARDTGDPEKDPSVIEDTWCYTLAPDVDGSLVMLEVDMSTGAWSEAGRWSGVNTDFFTGGLARVGDLWVYAGLDGDGWSWFTLDTGAGTLAAGADAGLVVSVAWSGSERVTVDPFTATLSRYASVADLEAGAASGVVEGVSGLSRLDVDHGVVYGAWHSTDRIRLLDLYSGADLGTVMLDDWDTWVWGVSFAGGKIHVIDDGRQYTYQRINAYDPATGAIVDSVALPALPYAALPSGLWCTDTAP